MSEELTLRQWTLVVRRARLGRTVKAIAFALATYADSDGSSVRPGVARLSYECELSYTSVKSALRQLRAVGLIEKVGRHGDADVYQLILHEDLLERVTVPTPTQCNVDIEKIRATWKGTYSPGLRSTPPTAEADPESHLRSTRPTADTRDRDGSAVGGVTPKPESAVNGTTHLRSTRPTATSQDRPTTETSHSDKDLQTDITVPRDSLPNEDPISPPADLASRPRCPHGKSTRHENGLPRCVDCRAEVERITAEAVKIQLGPTKCDAHKRPIGKCHFCRRGLPGAEA